MHHRAACGDAWCRRWWRRDPEVGSGEGGRPLSAHRPCRRGYRRGRMLRIHRAPKPPRGTSSTGPRPAAARYLLGPRREELIIFRHATDTVDRRGGGAERRCRLRVQRPKAGADLLRRRHDQRDLLGRRTDGGRSLPNPNQPTQARCPRRMRAPTTSSRSRGAAHGRSTRRAALRSSGRAGSTVPPAIVQAWGWPSGTLPRPRLLSARGSRPRTWPAPPRLSGPLAAGRLCLLHPPSFVASVPGFPSRPSLPRPHSGSANRRRVP